MKKYRQSKSSLFLLEIMLNILFFVVLATICLQLFFKTNNLSKDTKLLHRAVTACTSIAEVYQSSPNGEEVLLSIYPEAIVLKDTILIYFDYTFSPCNEFEGTYRAVLSDNPTNHSLQIMFFNQEYSDVIYQLNVSSYSPRTLDELAGGVNP